MAKQLKSRTLLLVEKRLWQTLFVVLFTAICWIPLWIFLGCYHSLGPSGFWQKLVTLGLGFVIGGSIQFFAAIGWVAGLISWTGEIGPRVPSKWDYERQKKFNTGY